MVIKNACDLALAQDNQSFDDVMSRKRTNRWMDFTKLPPVVFMLFL